MTLLEYYQNGGNPNAEVVIIGVVDRYREGKLSEWTDWNSPEGREMAEKYFVRGCSEWNGDEAEEGPYVVAARPEVHY